MFSWGRRVRKGLQTQQLPVVTVQPAIAVCASCAVPRLVHALSPEGALKAVLCGMQLLLMLSCCSDAHPSTHMRARVP